MKLFTVGPVQMYEHTLQLGGRMLPYFRTQEFSEMMLETDRLLKRILQTDEHSACIYLTASGTGAMEAAVVNCVAPQDRVLVISGGSFGRRFEEICRMHAIAFDAVCLSEGERLTSIRLERYEGQKYAALLVNLHETSTGQLYDIVLLRDFCRRNGMYLIVDAISTFLCDPFAMDENGIDVTILSAQKGLCLPPGISIVVLSERIIKERVEKVQSRTVYFDFKAYIENFKRGQTPFTPAVGIFLQLHDMVRCIAAEGVAVRVEKVRLLCADFRARVTKLPLHMPAYTMSNAMTLLQFESPVARRVFETLKNEYDIFVNPCGGAWADTALRVAHIGDLTMEDNHQLVACLEHLLEK